MHAQNKTNDMTLRPREGRIQWEGMTIRLLGACWGGSRTMYEAGGKRLSRLPVTVGKAGVLPANEERPFGPQSWKGPLLYVLWELSGAGSDPSKARLAVIEVNDVATDRPALPSGPRKLVLVGQKRLEWIACIPGSSMELHLHGVVLGDEDRDSKHRVWWDFGFESGLDTQVCYSKPGWGAACVIAPRPAPTKGHLLLHLTYSSSVMPSEGRLFGLDGERREVTPVWQGTLRGMTPEGMLHMVMAELPLPVDGLYGLALYPRRQAHVDWGKLSLPPQAD